MTFHFTIWWVAMKEWIAREIVPPDNERLMWDVVWLGKQEMPQAKLVDRLIVGVDMVWAQFQEPDGTLKEITITPEDVKQFRKERW